MPKHKPETATLGELINLIEGNRYGVWYGVMDIEIPGLQDALDRGEEDDFASANEIESEYVQAHCEDVYEIIWPEHVTVPAYNSDATYRLLDQ